MPTSLRRRTPSPGARLEWRPSTWVVAMLAGMGTLAAIGTFASEVPLAAVVAGLSLLAGIGSALRESRRPHRMLVVGTNGSATLDGRPLATLRLHWRGPLAFLDVRDTAGRAHRLAWWPDTLDREGRRTLKLAIPTPRPPRRGMRR